MASNFDDQDESFTSKFRDYFIEEDVVDSAAISPYASVSEADLCTYYSEGFLKQIWETKKLFCPRFTKYKEFARPVHSTRFSKGKLNSLFNVFAYLI